MTVRPVEKHTLHYLTDRIQSHAQCRTKARCIRLERLLEVLESNGLRPRCFPYLHQTDHLATSVHRTQLTIKQPKRTRLPSLTLRMKGRRNHYVHNRNVVRLQTSRRYIAALKHEGEGDHRTETNHFHRRGCEGKFDDNSHHCGETAHRVFRPSLPASTFLAYALSTAFTNLVFIGDQKSPS